jgi:hypothetical protein
MYRVVYGEGRGHARYRCAVELMRTRVVSHQSVGLWETRASSDVGHFHFRGLFLCALQTGDSGCSSTVCLLLLTLGTDGKPLFCVTVPAADDEDVGARLFFGPALVLDARFRSSVWHQRGAANLTDETLHVMRQTNLSLL